MLLALLLLATTALGSDVFPERMCERLPEVHPVVKAWVAQVAPDLAEVPVRDLSEQAARDVFGRAAQAGWGGIDLFTDDVFREPCAFYLSPQTLRALDKAFEFDLLTVIHGKDVRGREFAMLAMIAGRGKLRVFYERGGIVYHDEKEHRDFELAARVDFDTPARGRLENVRGLCTEVLLLGCLDIHSLVKEGDAVEIRAGLFATESPLTAIRVRAGTPPPAPARAREPQASAESSERERGGGPLVLVGRFEAGDRSGRASVRAGVM